MKKNIILFLVFVFLLNNSFSQSSPKQELRGVWMATVANLDWPSAADKGNPAKQKQSFIALIESLQKININVVLFQVRTECDAFYNSSYEPWSRFLTDIQGLYPGYDPLQFAIEECHKRGMELHVWLNPYRVNASIYDSGNYYASNHVYRKHPAWVMKYSSGKKILNPGLPQVQKYIKNIVGDILSKYDVDGVHFDDYFYSYSGTPDYLDASAYSKYGSEYATIGDFRRASINKMIRGVMDTILAVKPYVRFGVSPFGIYGNNMNPPGIVGLDAYNVIYCDPLAWLKEKSVDYISPQLYWPTGGSQDFSKLLPWWATHTKTYQRNLYAGHAIYKLDDNPVKNRTNSMYSHLHELKEYYFLSGKEEALITSSWSLSEILKQIKIVRQHRYNNAMGSIFFRTKDFNRVRNLKTYIYNNAYKNKALLPVQKWKNFPAVTPVSNAGIKKLNGDLNYSLTWEVEPGFRYAVYMATDSTAFSNGLPESRYLSVVLFDKNHIKLNDDILRSGYYFAVVKLNRYWQPSENKIFKIPSSRIPHFSTPAQAAIFNEEVDSVYFEWNNIENATGYRLQLSDTVNFEKIIIDTLLIDNNFIYQNPPKKKWLYAQVAAIFQDSITGYWSPTVKFTLNTGLAVEDFAATDNILVYPNPFASKINIDFGATGVEHPVQLELVDISGRILDIKNVKYLPKHDILTWDIKQYQCQPCFIRIKSKKSVITKTIFKYR